MILTPENTEGKQVFVYDCRGSVIPGVLRFDTETCEIEMLVWLGQREGDRVRPLLFAKDAGGSPQPVSAKIKIPGAFAVVDGQRI